MKKSPSVYKKTVFFFNDMDDQLCSLSFFIYCLTCDISMHFILFTTLRICPDTYKKGKGNPGQQTDPTQHVTRMCEDTTRKINETNEMQTVSSAQHKHCTVHMNEEEQQQLANLVWELSKTERLHVSMQNRYK